jgi:uncharacterized membrane protein YfcA
MLIEQITLCMLAFISGLIDAAVGGGGLVLLPGLFTVFPTTSPALLFGTNKFSAALGTLIACWRYTRQINLPWRLLLPVAGYAFIGAFIGATAVSFMPPALIRPLVLVLLLLMLIYTLIKKDFGQIHHPRPIGKRELSIGLMIGAGIGFYDGFFGPGTGSFLIFLFIRYFQFDFLTASAAAKIVNLSTNLAALCFFIPAGKVWYVFAVPMAMCSILGAMVGAHLAMRGGSRLIRKLFIVLVLTMMGKLLFDAF